MTAETFANTNSAGLAFTNISATEIDTVGPGGGIGPFVNPSAPPVENTENVGAYQALDFAGYTAGAQGPGSSINVTLSYNVASTVAGQGISALQQSFTPDSVQGLATLIINESVYDANGNLVGTTSTNLANINDPTSSGAYAFGDLVLNQSYANLRVVVTISATVVSTAAATDIVAFSDIEQGFSTSALSVAPKTGTLSGTAFLDANADGTEETGEANLSGITVQLLDSNGNVIVGSTTTTDANGHYSFTGLNAGNYAVVFIAPNGDKFDSVSGTSTTLPNSIVNSTGQTAEVAVVGGQTTSGQNAGLYVPGTFTAHIYADANKNGMQDTGDTNLAGVTVNLLNGSGVATGVTAITDANGNVTFAGLTPGSYEVSVTTPTGDTVTQHTNIGTPVTLTSGQSATATEGLFVPNSLSGHVFLDTNADGVQEAGETNLAGVSVSLLTGAGVATGTTALTDANGNYSFSGLTAGSYEVKVTAPTGDKFSSVGTSTTLPDSIVNSTGTTNAVSLTGGTNVTGQNAGVYAPGTITTHVYGDNNKNGTQDSGDTNLAGVTVNLLTGTGAATGTTAITDANGNVSFAGLAPGSYEVSVNTPTGDTVTQAVSTTPVTLVSGGTASFTEGLFVPNSLSGQVFLDTNADGVQEAGETNLAGVSVSLLTGAGVATGTTALTDANGNYSFSGLTAGSYEVKVTAPTGDKFSSVGTSTTLPDSIVNSAGTTNAVSLTGGTNVTGQNAGVFAPASFTAHIYADANKDSSQDNGEGNLAGVTVNLLNGSGVATGVTAITDANGNVTFAGLTPGSYEVSVTTPTGDTVTQHTNIGTPATLTSGQSATATEGLFNPGGLSGHVFLDANDNGVQDTGDTNIQGVTVSLYTSSGTNTGLTAVTDSNGFYQFSGLVAGTYIVAVGAPAGDKFDTVTGTNANPGVDSIVNTAGMVATVVNAGTITPNQNAGVFAPGTISVHLYDDANNNGVQDTGDTNIAGSTVSLLTSTGAPTGLTAVTDANGNVSFTGLTPGSYEIAVTNPGGSTVTQPGLITVSAGAPMPVGLTSGGNVTTTEGVFIPGALTGHIFLDQNADGIQETGDTNLAGVTVTLLNSSGASTGTTAITDANGAYTFNNLVAGTYSVAFTAPTGDKFSAVTTVGNAAADSIVNTTTGKTSPVSVVSGSVTANQNAAVYVPATITTHVYGDNNKNGTQDSGDTNLAGVTVNLLTGTGAATGTTAITDANGNVSFAGLAPGSYEVSVNTPTGDTVTQAVSTTPVTLVSGGTASFTEGLFAPNSLSGHVFLDTNADGIQESGETNLAGINVQLLNGSGVATGATAITDANGNYSFSGLTAGSYEVKVTAPTGDKFSSVGTSTTLPDSIVNSAGTTNAVSLTGGTNVTGQNAGVFAPASFTAHIYADANKDSSQDNGEGNLAGVTVNLLNGSGVATGVTAITDANGNVSFAGLTPGSYEVSVVTPTGDTVTQHSNVGTPITLTSGQTASATEGLFNPGGLSGHVFLDANDNGVQDTGDTNIQGVTVSLYTSSGTNTGLTAVTDSNGFYQFSGLVAGTYIVAVGAPAGDKFDTVTGTNANPGVDSIVNTAGMVATVVNAGTITPNQNAGVFAPATFTTHVYFDNNDDSVQDNGESNLAGVTVNLLNGSGVATGTTAITDANGNVSFAGLTPGSYEVSVVTPSGDLVSQHTNVGTPVTLTSGQTATATEGLYGAGSLCGRVFVDYNANGIFGTSGASTLGPNLITNGSFEAQNVGSSYTIFANGGVTGWTSNNNETEIDNSKLLGLTAPDGSQSLELNGNTYDTISQTVTGLTVGATYVLGYDYAGRPGAGNQETDVSVNGVKVATNTSTGSTGLGFTANTVTFVATSTSETISFAAINVGSNQPCAGNEIDAVTLNKVTTSGVLQDYGVPNQTVTLLTSTGAATGITTTTDANGNYCFTNLAAGSYEVQFSALPGDKFDGVVGNSANAALNSVVTPGGLSPVETVTVGTMTSNVNAGEYAPATITTHVYSDTNKNSAQDTGETNLAGITVNLLNGNGVATGTTAITDANGNVSFTGLTPGSYEVSVVTPTGDTVTQATNIATPITLTSGQTANAIEGLNVPKAGITITKTPSVTTTTPGVSCPPLTYTFVVTNTGNTTLNGVSIVDVTNGNPATAVTYTDPNALAAGASWTYTTPVQTVAETKSTTPTIGSGHGFDLGDALTYGIIAFHPGTFTEASCSPVIGNVGVGSYGALNVSGGGISGDLETTGALPGYNTSTSWNWSTWSWQTVSTGCSTISGCSTSGTDTSYGSVGWAANWGHESGGSSNCYSNFGCSGSTGSAVWDNFWGQSTTATTCPLVLNCSEDAWQGDAQFTVTVDGKQVGGTYSCTASHSCGQSQAFNLGNFAGGSHTIAVNFLNDAYGGSASADRNLYVNTISDAGYSISGSAQMSSGSVSYCTSVAAVQTTCDLKVNVSEDAWQGDAQFTVTVDGKQCGGTYTATACHGSGQSQGFDLGQFGLGAHTVSVNFLNDAYGGSCSTDRNLYVDSIIQNGVTIGGAELASSGALNFLTTAGSVGGDDSDDSWGTFFNNSCSSSCYSSSYSGGAYGQIANSTSLAADIAGLTTLGTQLFAEAGTAVTLGNGTNLMATAGKLDASGNEVFTVSNWSSNFTVTGDGTHSVVLDVAAGTSINLGQLSLAGGISANQVMIDYQGTNTITDTNCNTVTNATVLAPNAAINLASGTVNGHLYGGASNQNFTVGSGSTVEAPPLTSYTLTDTATATGTSGSTTVTANASASVLVNPTASGISQNCNAPSSCDNLWNDYGQAQKLEFCFNPGTSVNTNSGSCGISAGSCSTGTASNPCFITITDSASDSTSGCKTYYEGNVCSGQKVIADASQNWDGSAASGCFSTTSNAMLYCHVYTSQAACQSGQSACQEIAYDTSGAHGISLGDQVGCLQVVGYVSTSGHGYTC